MVAVGVPPVPPSCPYSEYGEVPSGDAPGGIGRRVPGRRLIAGNPTGLSMRTSRLSVPGATVNWYALIGPPRRVTDSVTPATLAVPRSAITSGPWLVITPALTPEPATVPLGFTPSLITAT